MSNPTLKWAELRSHVRGFYSIPDDADFYVLAVTCGLPQSGKSTWARTYNVPTVDSDSVRLAFQGRPYLKDTEDWVQLLVRVMVRSLFYAGHRDVIVQGHNVTAHSRVQWLPNDLWYPIFCVFGTPVEECLARVKQSIRPDLKKAIHHLSKIWQPPTRDEGPVLRVT